MGWLQQNRQNGAENGENRPYKNLADFFSVLGSTLLAHKQQTNQTE